MTARAPSPAEALRALCEDYWQFGLDESPVSCTYLGDRRADDRLDENTPEARERRDRAMADFQGRLAAIPPFAAGSEDEVTRRILALELAHAREALGHRSWEWEVDQIFGLQVLLPNLMAFQPVEDEKAMGRLEARLRAAPKAFAEHERDLKDGLAKGRTPPRLAVERVVKQVRDLLAQPVEALPFTTLPVQRMPAAVPPTDRARWTARLAKAVTEAVRPAYARYLEFLAASVLPAARTTVGLWSIPGGPEEYAFRVRRMTTTDLTPERIHAIGVEEMAKNQEEMLAIARSVGHRGDLRAFLDAIRGDRRFRLDTRDAILDRYRAICARMDAALPTMFGRLPGVGYEVKPIEAFREKDSPAAFYQPPPDDRSRLGIFYANTHDPSSWPTYDYEALCFHEAVPGHHLQIALAQETKGLPAFRRHGGFTAYVEGWAHYSERLADEMGMYSTPYDRVGMLAAQAWRAVRLVVDTGMHHLRWTRDRAIEAMESVRSGSRSDVENEVDRYVIWPGQALAYKVGSRTITELRERARRRLGKRFRLPAFHDLVLRLGAVPLSILEEALEAWAGESA